MKKLTYSLLSLLTLLFVAVGCSKSAGDDAVSLLKTVPADASSVVVINIAHTVESLGGSTDGSTIKLGKQLQKAIDESQAIKEKDKKEIKELCDGETGVSITSLAVFAAARTYLTGLLNDPEKFVAYVEKETGSQAVEENGAKVIGEIAVIGNQFWACMTGRPDVDQLKYYQQLNDKQSYASADAASLLLEGDKVMTFVADINKSLALVPQAAYFRMASSLIFNDMSYLAGSADLQKKSFVGSAVVLNSEMKPAELLLPVEKLDASLIKSFGQGGDLFFAVGIPAKLTKKIIDIASSAMGPNSKAAAAVLESIDGTVAVRCNSGASDAEARIQTNGKNFNDLSSVLQSLLGMTVTRDGNTLTAVVGSKDFTGTITPAVAADKLKGAWMGMVSNGVIARDVTTVTKLISERKSLRLEVEVDGGVDALITALTK